ARLERADEDRDLPLRRHDLFAIELVAFEFLGRRVLVLDDKLDLLSRRHRELRGNELVLAEDQPHIGVLPQGRPASEQEAAGEDERRYPQRWHEGDLQRLMVIVMILIKECKSLDDRCFAVAAP